MIFFFFDFIQWSFLSFPPMLLSSGLLAYFNILSLLTWWESFLCECSWSNISLTLIESMFRVFEGVFFSRWSEWLWIVWEWFHKFTTSKENSLLLLRPFKLRVVSFFIFISFSSKLFLELFVFLSFRLHSHSLCWLVQSWTHVLELFAHTWCWEFFLSHRSDCLYLISLSSDGLGSWSFHWFVYSFRSKSFWRSMTCFDCAV